MEHGAMHVVYRDERVEGPGTSLANDYGRRSTVRAAPAYWLDWTPPRHGCVRLGRSRPRPGTRSQKRGSGPTAQSALSEGTSTARHEAILEGEPTGRYSDDLVTTELYTYQWVGMERSLPIELQVGPVRCQS